MLGSFVIVDNVIVVCKLHMVPFNVSPIALFVQALQLLPSAYKFKDLHVVNFVVEEQWVQSLIPSATLHGAQALVLTET